MGGTAGNAASDKLKALDKGINEYLEVAAVKKGLPESTGTYCVAVAQIGLATTIAFATHAVAFPMVLPFFFATVIDTICKLVSSAFWLQKWKLKNQVGVQKAIGDAFKNSDIASGNVWAFAKLCWGCSKFLLFIIDSVYQTAKYQYGSIDYKMEVQAAKKEERDKEDAATKAKILKEDKTEDEEKGLSQKMTEIGEALMAATPNLDKLKELMKDSFAKLGVDIKEPAAPSLGDEALDEAAEAAAVSTFTTATLVEVGKLNLAEPSDKSPAEEIKEDPEKETDPAPAADTDPGGGGECAIHFFCSMVKLLVMSGFGR